MFATRWNRLDTSIVALAGGGILAAAGAAVQANLPKGSTLESIGTFLLLGLLVAAFVMAFRWFCEARDGRTTRPEEESWIEPAPSPRTVVNPRGAEHVPGYEYQVQRSEPKPNRPIEQIPLTLRGMVQTTGGSRARLVPQWRGQ